MIRTRTRTAPRARSLVRSPAILVVLLLASASACSSSGGDRDGTAAKGATTTAAVAATTASADRSDSPAAKLSELTGDAGPFIGAASATAKLADVGWVEHEYAASGSAVSYETDGPFPADGRIELTEGTKAGYRTRVLVRRPAKAEDFHGTVVVEWLNVSGGVDANPDYAFAAAELQRQGIAWVGVSAQQIGVEGGEVAVSVSGTGDLAGKGLKGIDPERYGSLEHPGDAYAYDIYTQVARAIRTGGGAMGDLDVERVLAVGESQSGFALTTYVDGVQPRTHAFDGFLLHSRGGAALPLGTPGEGVSISNAIGGPPVRIRTDQDVPVLMVETETDLFSVIGYYPARQPDTDHIRTWEVAGTAHADAFLLGPTAASLDCGVPINDGPQQYVVRAAFAAIERWVRTGDAPPEAPLIEVTETGGKPAATRDSDGIAQGGIRLPQVAVPVRALSGEAGPRGGVICLLLGSSAPFTADQLAARYSSRAAYAKAYERATDAAISDGFALEADRQAILDEARPALLAG